MKKIVLKIRYTANDTLIWIVPKGTRTINYNNAMPLQNVDRFFPEDIKVNDKFILLLSTKPFKKSKRILVEKLYGYCSEVKKIDKFSLQWILPCYDWFQKILGEKIVCRKDIFRIYYQLRKLK